MLFTISNPEKILLKTEAKLLQLPGMDGWFEVLDRHAPILSMLKQGRIRIVDPEGNESFYEIRGKGLFGMVNNDARLLLL